MFRIFNTKNQNYLNYIVSHSPNAVSHIKGNRNAPNISGLVEFYQIQDGVLVVSKIENLNVETNTSGFYAMHIHSGNNCEQNNNGEFSDAPHYNPNNVVHPKHAGDLTNLLSNNGFAFSVVLTDRFNVNEILGKTIMVHSGPDDERTDPSGNSGTKIACGKIVNRF